MRKKLITGLCAATMTFAAATTALGIDNGTWDLSTGVQNGFWQEVYSGGGPGQPGNVLTGGDGGTVLLDQYLLGFGLTLGSVAPGAPGEYFTTYTGGQINLLDGPWGDGASFSPLTAWNHSFSGNGLKFELNLTGVISSEATGQIVDVKAVFDSTDQNSTYGNMLNPAGAIRGHQGSGFQALSVTIRSVPDTGSTLALLCPALFGLVAWSRMRFSTR